MARPAATATRIVFADKLTTGDTVTDQCRGHERVCPFTATRHEPDHTHERTIIDLRSGPVLIQAITVDEDGEQQPLAYGPNATVRILVRDPFPAAQPTEETRR